MSVRTDRNLQLLFGSLFFWSFGIGLYDSLLPIYARQLGASPIQLGTLFTLRHLALAAGFLVGWAVADRLSPRVVIGASWNSSTPVPLLLAAAPSYAWLLPGLLLYEFAYFGLPAVHAYITRRVPPSELASTFGIMGTITSSGFVIAPTIGGFVAEQWGIRATLGLAAVFYLLSTTLILRVRHDEGGTAVAEASRSGSWAEMRPLWPAMWIYTGATLVILLTGGSKKRQQRDIEAACACWQDYKRRKGEKLSVPEFKELTGVTRKYAIPLLEYLDRQRVTRRAGDQRLILV